VKSARDSKDASREIRDNPVCAQDNSATWQGFNVIRKVA